MKLKIGLRAAVAGALILLGSGCLRPAFAGLASITSGRVVCSTTPASPTLVSAANPFWHRTILQNANTDYILIGDSGTAFSTATNTGNGRLVTPASTAAQHFELDSEDEYFTGSIYCVGSGSGGTNILDYWRFK